MIGWVADRHFGFFCSNALDPDGIVAHHVQAFAPGLGVRPNDRMTDRRIAIDFRLDEWEGTLRYGAEELSRRLRGLRFRGLGRRSERHIGGNERGQCHLLDHTLRLPLLRGLGRGGSSWWMRNGPARQFRWVGLRLNVDPTRTGHTTDCLPDSGDRLGAPFCQAGQSKVVIIECDRRVEAA
jgi:hypothetical protein